jgi:cellulose synthase/poly-beta-1,6-N-acetylglucosamine synthase-like glycosyltransferase
MKMEGVSFMVRARDEEQTLEACVRSLLPLRIPMEIVVVLHRCTDGSAGIVEGLAREDERIRVYEYHEELSRAGYETLATSAGSRHSIVAYDNWCFAKTRLPWVFKWDADFVCTDELRAFLDDFLDAYNRFAPDAEVRVDAGPGPFPARVDKVLMKRVLANLTTNY